MFNSLQENQLIIAQDYDALFQQIFFPKFKTP